ncbi:ribosome biogenesis GTPase YlqF [Mycoplasma zalophi]|uniref:ribosome biogenesis GTPase YlqF n=1 Tax=Mycoplasma zalophi TaxID=191287 RepID=UPI001C10D089|nr:ribosome biogenesis GTPase YlqF [Mycoplasma zalophi]MBU4690722.1 ribosome biogenesis GTPase YlqF [Mycoplasma zalophi]
MINWFPGHMKKAFDIIKQKQSLFDMFLIVLDSRIPISSYNHEFDKIAPQKPRIFVFTKTDLTNLNRFNELKKLYNNENDILVSVNLKNASKSYQLITKAIKKVTMNIAKKNLKKGYNTPPPKIGVLGVPNSGKSTLINILAQQKVAKVGNEAGITRSEQWVNCKDQFFVLDTPGLLWPKFENQDIAIKLAIIGSIKKDSIDLKEFVYEAYKLVSKYKPEALNFLNLEASEDEEKIYENIITLARMKKYINNDKQVQFNQVYVFLVNYFKNLNNVIYD